MRRGIPFGGFGDEPEMFGQSDMEADHTGAGTNVKNVVPARPTFFAICSLRDFVTTRDESVG